MSDSFCRRWERFILLLRGWRKGVGKEEGEAKMREVNQDGFLGLHFCLSRCQKQSRPARWWDISECEAEADSWQRRRWPPGWQGHRTMAYNRDCSPCNRASVPPWMDQDTTLLSKHATLLWLNCACLESAEADYQSRAVLCSSPDPGLPHLEPLSCLAGWRGLWGQGWGQSTIPFPWSLCFLLCTEPGPSCVCPKKPLPLDNKWSWIYSAMFRNSITYIMHCLLLTSSGYARGKSFWMLPVMDEMRPYPRYKSNWHPMNPFKVVCWKWPNITVCRSNISYGKKLWRRSSYSTLCCSKDFP